MSDEGLTLEEMEAEFVTVLPDKEVVSILDLNVDVDVFIDAASPIDLAAAAQLNVAAPIDASAAANVLAYDSGAQAENFQTGSVDQILVANAYATSDQASDIIQSDETDGDPTPADEEIATPELGLFEGPLLNVDVNVDLDADLAAPIAGAVAANANVAAPISASVAANVITIESDAIAYTDQEMSITQELRGDTVANAVQDSSIDQGTSQPDADTTSDTTADSGGESTAGTASDSTGSDAGSATAG
ncbi:peptidoglycan-binding protein [Mycobacterium sp. pV006]|uniref:peptidoglycan-binding protein n=1 Tax=Mycobacterium sp. pV006 TaxID=3238983 RepID=UPI00351B1584